MTAARAMIKEPFTAGPEQTIGDVIKIFTDKKVRAVPVVDGNGMLLGLITLRIILKNVLPISATMEHGLESLDFLADTTEGAAKKLGKILDKPVADLMDENCVCASTDTSKWEAIRLMVKSNTILPVIDKKTRELKGVMTAQSTLTELDQTMKEIQAEKAAQGEDTA